MDVTEKMAALFGVDVRTISYHIGQIYETGELDKTTTIRKIGIVKTEGERDVERAPLFYNLDVMPEESCNVNLSCGRFWGNLSLTLFMFMMT